MAKRRKLETDAAASDKKDEGSAPQARTRGGSRPVLFISHKHSDSKIADALHRFFEDWGEKQLDIEQTSFSAKGLPIGENLNEALLDRLNKAGVLLLIYTRPDEDWSWCMWEAGASTNPQQPSATRTLVIYCMGKPPKVFGNDVMVDARKLGDIENLANQFLTEPKFFPTYGKPLSRHEPGGKVVKDRAKRLFEALQEVLPPLEQKPPYDWPAWPWIRFELSLDEIETLASGPKEQGCKQILTGARIIQHDKNAARLLKKVSLEDVPNLEALLESWRRKMSGNGQNDEGWCHSLCSQIYDAACEDYPSPEWKQVCDVDGKAWFLPMLIHVHVRPAESRKLFDVYFPRIQVEAKGSYSVSMPNEPDVG